jgi:hypothetical protein
MKACLLLQRKFAFIGHKLAISLKEKYGINEFCGLVCVRSSYEFLKDQKDITYTSLLLDEDMHNKHKTETLDLDYLKNLEKEYGIPNLWPYIALDRVLMFDELKREYPYNTPPYSHEKMMRIFQVTANAVIGFLEKEKPDFVFITTINTVSAMLLYQIAKKKNIRVFLGIQSRINNGYLLTNDYKNFSWVEERFDDLSKNIIESPKLKEAQEHLKKFREKPTKYFATSNDGVKTNSLNELKWFLSKDLWRSLSWAVKLTYRFIANKKWLDYAEEEPITFITDRVKRKIRTLIGYERFYDPVDLTEDFAFFPLHYEPEMTTLLYAPFWTDQINLIRQISKSLPIHFKLYVKEHPGMIRYRPFSYYKELKKIPNVKLINPDQVSFELIKNSKLIVTITGTAGWEGIILKKPIITFGDIFYNKLSVVKRCRDIEQLPYIVKQQLENFQHNEKELENFICSIMEESSPVGLPEIWFMGGVDPKKEKQRIGLIAYLLAKKLGLEPIDTPPAL